MLPLLVWTLPPHTLQVPLHVATVPPPPVGQSQATGVVQLARLGMLLLRVWARRVSRRVAAARPLRQKTSESIFCFIFAVFLPIFAHHTINTGGTIKPDKFVLQSHTLSAWLNSMS